MPRQGQARRLATALVATAMVLGCGKKSDKTGADGEGADDPTATVAKDAAPPPPNPGRVFFAVEREGVIELVGGEFTRVIESSGRISDLAVSASGGVFAVADAQVLAANGSGGAVVGNRTEPGLARRIETSKDGVLWAIGGKGLWRREGDVWSADETFPSPRTVTDIATTPTGQVIAAARTVSYVLAADGWQTIELPDPPPEPKRADAGPGADVDGVGDSGDDGIDEGGGPSKRTVVRQLVTGADGQVYISLSIGIYRLENNAWTVVTNTPVTALAVAADGTIIAAAESGAILWGRSGTLEEREIASLGIAATELDAIATDSLGRVWLATDGGLVITDAKGEPQLAYSAASQPGLPGRIAAIRVLEAPTILPTMTERKTGTVIGRIVGLDKKNVAGVTVEICARPDTMFRGSPCIEAAYKNTAVTGDDGVFRLDEVPAGRYGFAIKGAKDKDEWIVDLTIDCCAQLFAEGEVKLKRISILP